MLTGRLKHDNLYYADRLSDRVFDGRESLFDSDPNARRDRDAFIFGLALVYFIDEANGTVAPNDWTYSAVLGDYDDISYAAHDTVWSVANSRRHCDATQTATCMVFTRTAYILLMQSLDAFRDVISGVGVTIVSLLAHGTQHVKPEFNKTTVCSHVYPFVQFADDLMMECEDGNGANTGLAVLHPEFEKKFAVNVPGKIDLDRPASTATSTTGCTTCTHRSKRRKPVSPTNPRPPRTTYSCL
ncbi:unnamed protein product [Ixodes persulcatus]